ncbi:hypothetical protein LG943_06165 [Streptomonospora sp. S1-112]|uniref:Uncharacterized protein n=1 Tax=Streptomonospora mangrovi TaxID=2883123 RepID=A0A9X3NKR8_9ACTN|nr:hypothetical protein [Streptomonospora mangrovi]MDA0563913.1 hypothetical protein [Streptomonospora mangrovi]
MRGSREAGRLLCDFDSSVTAVRAMGRFLRGRDFPGLGTGPGSARLGDLASALPEPARRRAFVLGGAGQARPAARIAALTGEDLAAWTADHYGPGPFPAVFVGSGSGAALHLAAALGAPVLPQTFLLPVRARLDPDDPRAALRHGRPLGRLLLDRNPDLDLCHMHDPNQDRAMVGRFMYFRVKRLRLGAVLTRFLRERLAPGGTVFVLDCPLRWPATVLGERQRFQFGALGGIPPHAYTEGGEPVARFLAEQGAAARTWDAPEADAERPEAEWGYDDALTADLRAVAAERGLRLRRVTVPEPELLSPLVAELYHWWYARLGLPADRLVVETYNQWEPYWAMRTGSVPFWLHFPTAPSRDRLADHLRAAPAYRDIHVNLFSNGLRSMGQLPAAEWGALARRHATGTGGLLGVNARAYPTDIGGLLRYRSAFAALGARQDLPPPLTLAELEEFLESARGGAAHRPVRVADEDTGAGTAAP